MTQNENKKQAQEVSTLLRLIAPEFVDVELVPLSSVERAEFLFFWSTVFLTVWGTVLGAWLSLTLVDYANVAVLNLLLAVLVFFSFLVVSFSASGFRARRTARRAARHSAPAVAKLTMPEKMDRVNTRFLAFLPDEFTEEQFKQVANKFDDNDNDTDLQSALFDRLIVAKTAVVVEGASNPVRYRAAKPQV